MGKFIVTQDRKGEFRFKLNAANGETILVSEGYKAKHNCNVGIEAVQKNAIQPKRFKDLESNNGKYYFVLRAGNSQIIGTSQMYKSISSRDIGKKSVEKNAPTAEIEIIKENVLVSLY